ncbi:MAG: response regulator [Candidatus Omnitrophica bacterium]|nr:Regulator of RpoS [bacterium]NUN98123.1 response regulator [Candidatus Omnitrophota bacterium]
MTTSSTDTEQDRRILVVDDDEDSADLTSNLLMRVGFEVSVAYDGESALASAHKQPPSAILLDLCLPGMDGYEVCRRFKQSETTRKTPIIVVSAHRSRESVLMALQSGADDFVVKPLDAHVLLHKLDSLMGNHVSRHTPARPKNAEDRSNRRQFVRLHQEAEGILHLPLRIVDISEGGVGLVGDSPVEPGSILQLRSALFLQVLALAEVSVQIRYCTPQRPRRTFRMGAEFVELSETKRKMIRQHIFKHQAQKVKTKGEEA